LATIHWKKERWLEESGRGVYNYSKKNKEYHPPTFRNSE